MKIRRQSPREFEPKDILRNLPQSLAVKDYSLWINCFGENVIELSVINVSNEEKTYSIIILYSHAALDMVYVASRAALAPSRPIPRIYVQAVDSKM